ncbi:hypothetical protein [Salinarimonas soli]|uniref:Uncharacterized protein n=1 Tax=Salinarimonas soli TaxID=1638099 RepID=A0A5B2VHF2_9HYPH|nr:hypothetical protein [Salinarimonas soli]KAA2237782.1 hypothetical protein F0L46_08890 [Salinarimonas soli]
MQCGEGAYKPEGGSDARPALARRRGVWATILLLAGFVAITSYPPAEASPPAIQVAAPATMRAFTVDPGSVAEADDMSCSRMRKRLWVDGTGWIVRRVSICR